MKRLLIPLMFIVLFSVTGFSQIYQYNINVELGDVAYYNVNIILVNYTDSTFSIALPGSPTNIMINSTSLCTQLDSVWGKEVKCIIGDASKATISISYETDKKLTKKDNYYIFSDSTIMPMNTDKLTMIVKLPEGMGLIKQEAYQPEDALLGSDGRRSFVYWDRDMMRQGETFDSSVAYEEVTSFDYAILEVILIVIITAVVIIVVALKYFSKQKSVQVILPVLKQDEKKIFEALIKHESGVKQKLIVTDSGYSKAKVSKILKSLNERGLVKLERIGRTNKVYYDEKFKKGQ